VQDTTSSDSGIDDAARPFPAKRMNGASGLTCPNCHGSVWELTEGGLPRIECRVGHAFSVDAFLGEQAVALEDAIWSAINSLEERASTLRRFAERFAQTPRVRRNYQEQAEVVAAQAALLREGLGRVIQIESSNSVPLPDPVVALDPEPMEGGPS
jgi:two-component system, chemotaxis family, protein-glutamate methylesterase/glutaminase